MVSIFLAFIVVPFLVAEGAAPPRLRPQCRSNVCDDRPECPRTSCSCLFPSRMDCSLYYQCVNGKPFQYRCSPGLLFNSEKLTCDYSYNVNCSFNTTEEPLSSTIVVNTTSTLMETTTETVLPNVTATPTDDLNNATTIHSSTETLDTTTTELSTNREITVTPNISTESPETPKAVTTNALTSETETMSTSAETSSKIATATSEITTETSTTAETTNDVKTSESPTAEISTTIIAEKTTRLTTTPTVSSTTDFIITSEQRSTSETTISETTTNVTSTKQYSTESTASPYTEVTASFPPTEFDCPSRFGLFPDPRSCFRFYDCSHWVPYHKWCPSNLHFNPVLKVCDWPYRAGCASSTTEEPLKSTIALNTSTIMETTTERVLPNVTATPTDDLRNVTTMHSSTENLDTTTTEFSTNREITVTPNITTESPDTPKAVTTTALTSETESMSTSEETSSKISTATNEITTENSTTAETTNDVKTSDISTAEISTTIIVETTTRLATTPRISSTTDFIITSEQRSTSETTISEATTNVTSTKQYSTESTTSPYTEVTTSFPPTNFDCPSRFGLFPDPRSCFRFYHCSHWVPYHKWCPSNLHFNPVLKVCDWPYRAGCDASDPTWVTGMPSSTPQPNDTQVCSCDSCELPIPGDCSSYILCVDRVATRILCGTGLYFNPMTGTCDSQGNVHCTNDDRCPESGRFLYNGSCSYFTECRDGNKTIRKCPEGLQFNASSEMCSWTGTCSGQLPDDDVEPKTSVNISICEGCNYCFKPFSSDCSSYVRCTKDIATKERCAPGLFFNPSTELCDHDYNVDCPVPEPQIECPESFGYFPYPGECGMYLQCTNGSATVKSCPGVLHFDARKKHCDWPWTAGCGDSDLTPTPEPNPETVTCDCDCCLKSVDNDCKSFILCINKVGFKRSCSSGLLFNPQTENCDFPENVECTVGPPDEPKLICPEYQGLFPYPEDCRKFIHCDHGIAHVKNCPSNLHFNPQLKVCDWAYKAGCQSYPVIQPTSDDVVVPCDLCESCFIPVGNDCASYIFCRNGTGYKLRCADSLLFNPKKESCDVASNVDCPNPPKTRCPNANGLFPAANCTQFIHCSNGIAYLKDCPAKLHFNAETLVCDWPDTAKCGGIPTPPTKPTDGITNTTKPDGVTNATIPDGVTNTTKPDDSDEHNKTCNCDCCFLPDAFDCSKYFLCLDGYLHEGHCSRGLLFNPAIENCDLAERVTCGVVTPLCPEPNGIFPDSDQCSSFIRCSSGTPNMEHCPNGTHFSAQRHQCLEPCEAKCDSTYDCSTTSSSRDTTTTTTTTTEPPRSTTQPPRSTTQPPRSTTQPPVCREPDGLYPVMKDCSSFYSCSNGRPYLVKCPDGLHYSAEYEVCDYPCDAKCDPSLDCSITSSSRGTTTTTTTTTQPPQSTTQPPRSTTQPPRSTTQPPVCREPDGLYPVMNDCSSFYSCSNGRPYLVKCPDGLHYSTEYEVCDYPCDAKCDPSLDCSPVSSSRPTTSSPISTSYTSPSSSFTISPNCPGGQSGLFPAKDDCSSFYHCSGGRAYLMKCPQNLHFSYEHQVCEYPCIAKCNDTIDCISTTSTTQEPSSTASTTSPECAEANGLFRNPNDCGSFYQCSNGKSHLIQCPSGLHFSLDDAACENPCVAGCDMTIDCSPTTPRTPSSTVSPHCLEAEGIYPVVDDCTAFYLCSNGKEHLIHCPPGLHYSEKHEICENPCVAGCNASIDCITSTKQETSSISPLSPECEEANGLFQNPQDCSTFYQCSNGKSHLIQCPSGLHFSLDDAACENPCVAGCDISIACPTEIPETEGNCTCEACYLPDPSDCSAFYFCSRRSLTKGYCPFGLLFDKTTNSCQDEDSVDCEANGDPIMCPQPFGFFPYPGDCKKFLHCDNEIAHVKTCPENLEYDPVNKVCTKPKGYCGDTPTDPHCLEPTGLFPDSTNCSSFYHCEHGVAYRKQCSPPLMFNAAKEVCDWPDNVDCGRDSTTRPSTISTPSTNPHLNTTTSPQPLPTASTQPPVSSTIEPCHEVPGVICPCACRVPTYDECSSFLQCQDDGTACKKFCPEGLYFNKREMVCDLPSNVECRDFFFATIKRAKYLNHHLHSPAKSR